ncbi:MAG: glycosyltransferase family 4 protein [Rhizobiales bacterium]|nr:glycosyltransferase family 4 protein [Hyphomicrobiales bacterium]
MKIAFYAPLKPPDHPVPSGDRQMARLLIKALEIKGHSVAVVSHLRAYLSDNGERELTNLRDQARAEVERIATDWSAGAKPDIWLTYHPYYRAPDLLGPPLAAKFQIPYVTLEASYARKRDRDGWANAQELVTRAIENAALNICFTKRDQDGLATLGPEIRLAYVPPFIDVADYDQERTASAGMIKFISVAMMRKGDKFDSYRMLAAALERLADLDWHLKVIGDGPLRGEVQSLFAKIPASRITWAGERAPSEIAGELRDADLYCWPGCGEAYGLAYLEAQAAGIPVVAQNIAGVPEVVRNGETGILTPAGDIAAYADAIRALAADRDRLQALGRQARQFVLTERTLEIASQRLDVILRQIITHAPSPAHAG